MKKAILALSILFVVVFASLFVLANTNNSKETAKLIQLNTSYESSVDPYNEKVDWFKVNIPQTGSIAIVVQILGKSSSWQKSRQLYFVVYPPNESPRKVYHLYQGIYGNKILDAYGRLTQRGTYYIQVSINPINISPYTVIHPLSPVSLLKTSYQIFVSYSNESYHIPENGVKYFNFICPKDPNVENFFFVLDNSNPEEAFNPDIAFLDFTEITLRYTPPALTLEEFRCISTSNLDWVEWNFLDIKKSPDCPITMQYRGKALCDENCSSENPKIYTHTRVFYCFRIPNWTPKIPDTFYFATKVIAVKGSGKFWVIYFTIKRHSDK